MKNIFIINAHQPYPFSQGKLNRTLTELAGNTLEEKGYSVRHTQSADGYSVEKLTSNAIART